MDTPTTTLPAAQVEALHRLRIAGSRGRDELDAAVGAGRVDELLAADLVKAAGTRVLLTPAGRALHEQVLAAQLDAAARAAVDGCYQRFLPLNADVLQLCTDWQIRVDGPSPLPNDHRDAAYDAAVVDRLRTVFAAARPLVDDLAAAVPRYALYGEGLAHAVEQIDGGDTDFLTNPRVRCFHTVWFELHEDLLATLGLDRATETGEVEP
jgi:hypothetical protein